MRKKLRVLVAEDEKVIRLHLKSLLKKLGHRVVAEASDGQAALQLIQQLQPDLVVTDIKMPNLSGLDLAEKVGERKVIPFVIVTAYNEEDLIDRAAKHAYVASYLVKPIQEKDLKPAIEMALSQCQKLSAMSRKVEDLEQSLEERKIIEKAKGIIMKASGLSEPEAHKRLQQLARNANKKIAEVANAILLAEEGFK